MGNYLVCGFHEWFHKRCFLNYTTISSNSSSHPGSFSHQLLSFLNFSYQVQICITNGALLVNSLPNPCCKILFDYVQEYSNTQNIFPFPVNGISISEKNKMLNIEFWVVSTNANKIIDQLNENWPCPQIRWQNDINISETPWILFIIFRHKHRPVLIHTYNIEDGQRLKILSEYLTP